MKEERGPEILAYLHSFDPGGVERTVTVMVTAQTITGSGVTVSNAIAIAGDATIFNGSAVTLSGAAEGITAIAAELEQYLREAMRVTRGNEARRDDFAQAVRAEHHAVFELDDDQPYPQSGSSHRSAEEQMRELIDLSRRGSGPRPIQDIYGNRGYCHVPLPRFKEVSLVEGEPAKLVAIVDIRKVPFA